MPERFHQTIEMRGDFGLLAVDVRMTGVETNEIEKVVDEFEQAQPVLFEHPGHLVHAGI
jgi:hypothetical protein